MSRCGYTEDLDQWDLIRWRGAVASAIRGKRGQAFLKEMLEALDALPEPRLIAHDLELDGEHCAIGSVGKARGMDLEVIDPEDPGEVAHFFSIADALVREIEHVNDEHWTPEVPEERFIRVRTWVVEQIQEAT